MELNEKFLEELANTTSPSGNEIEAQRVWASEMSKYNNKVELDNYGNCIATYSILQKNYDVVIDAHIDEISYMVSGFSDNYIKVVRNGGVDMFITSGQRAIIHTDTSKIPCVFGSIPIHVHRGEKEKTFDKVHELFIDCGCDNIDEIKELGIKVGDYVTMDGDFMKLGKNYYTGKSFDDKIGVFILSEVARKLKENKINLPYNLHFMSAVQEEVGCNGPLYLSKKLKADVAIVLDVTHDVSSGAYTSGKDGYSKCGLGPDITRAACVQNNLRKLIIDTAEETKIPYQLSASGSGTGTNTDNYALYNGAVSALISIPLKYMHSTVETVKKSDIENTVELLYNVLLKINKDQDFKNKL